jgi:hypothetical protein
MALVEGKKRKEAFVMNEYCKVINRELMGENKSE